MQEALLALRPATGDPAPAEQPIIESLLAGLVAYGLRAAGTNLRENAEQAWWEEELDKAVKRREGKRLTVAEAAGELHLSAGHLSALFRRAKNRPLKQHLDTARARVAAHLLAYSDESIGEIARRLEFPDVFAFSRFFRRVRGRCPSDYRRACNVQGIP